MFEIKYRATKSQSVICKVFDIRNDKAGYPHFLIYYDKQWKWISAKHCEPCETEYVDACVEICCSRLMNLLSGKYWKEDSDRILISEQTNENFNPFYDSKFKVTIEDDGKLTNRYLVELPEDVLFKLKNEIEGVLSTFGKDKKLKKYTEKELIELGHETEDAKIGVDFPMPDHGCLASNYEYKKSESINSEMVLVHKFALEEYMKYALCVCQGCPADVAEGEECKGSCALNKVENILREDIKNGSKQKASSTCA